MKWDFLPGIKTLEDLVLYEFNGGNQVVEANPSLLHLPQFREFKASTDATGLFDMEVFSPYGMPAYLALFARDVDFSLDAEDQPLIKEMSIMCTTTMKKSNTILEVSEHELYHITQRNVHPRAEYDRKAYRNRQVVMFTAEDIGMMGIEQYQKSKHVPDPGPGRPDRGRDCAVHLHQPRALRQGQADLCLACVKKIQWNCKRTDNV